MNGYESSDSKNPTPFRGGSVKSTILNADCLKIMAEWKDSYVDGIITSPPFRDADVEGDYFDWFLQLVSECRRVSRDYAIILNSSTRTKEICRRTDPMRIGTWHKPGGRMAYRYEPWFVYQGQAPIYNFNAVCWCDSISAHPVLRFRSTNEKVYDVLRKRSDLNASDGPAAFTVMEGHHPYENPLRLYLQLATYLAKGGSKIICDPCLGSGTTLVATEMLGLQGIGIEKNPEYCEIARKRVAEYTGQERLLTVEEPEREN
jgi:DNA modification methylase